MFPTGKMIVRMKEKRTYQTTINFSTFVSKPDSADFSDRMKTQTVVSSLQYFCLLELTSENDWGGGETGGQAVRALKRMKRQLAVVKRQQVSDEDAMSFQTKKNRKILRHPFQKTLDSLIIIHTAVNLRVISKMSEIDWSLDHKNKILPLLLAMEFCIIRSKSPKIKVLTGGL